MTFSRHHYYTPHAAGGVGERTPTLYRVAALGSGPPNWVVIGTDAANLRVAVADFGDFGVAGGPIVPIVPVFPMVWLLQFLDWIYSPPVEPTCQIPSQRLAMDSQAFRSLERLRLVLLIEALQSVTVDFHRTAFRTADTEGYLKPEWVWQADRDEYMDDGSLSLWPRSIVLAPPGCHEPPVAEPSPIRLTSGETRTFVVLPRLPLDPSGSFEMTLPRVDTEEAEVPLPAVLFERAVLWTFELRPPL